MFDLFEKEIKKREKRFFNVEGNLLKETYVVLRFWKSDLNVNL